MKYIISTLQKANNFHMDYQAPCINKATCATDPGDGIGAEKTLADHVQDWIQKNLNSRAVGLHVFNQSAANSII